MANERTGKAEGISHAWCFRSPGVLCRLEQLGGIVHDPARSGMLHISAVDSKLNVVEIDAPGDYLAVAFLRSSLVPDDAQAGAGSIGYTSQV